MGTGTYTLTIAGTGEDAAATGDLDITDDLTITGAGSGLTIIDGNSLDRVFDVISGTVAFLAYAGGHLPDAIWWGKPFSNAWKEVLDGLIYGLLTAGAFGWLWPR